MTDTDKALLTAVGQALYGAQWQTPLALYLGFPDGRRIRQWLTGDRPVPDRVWEQLPALLDARKSTIDLALADLRNRG